MEIDYCNYHYQSPATWYCHGCARHYGDCCVARADSGMKILRCVSCSNELQSLGAANKIEPFWNVIHKFLAYPFKPGPLVMILLMSLLANFAASAGLLGIGIGLFVLVVWTRYGFAIIEHTSMGKSTPPSLWIMLSRDPDSLFIKQIVVFFVAGLAMTAAGYTGSKLISLLVLAFITLAIPASILVLAVEKELTAAINPVLLTQIMAKMGLGYFVLYVFLNIISGGPYFVLEHFSGLIPESVYGYAEIAATIYFSFASANMMGYALLQYQKELGYRAELEEDLTAAGETVTTANAQTFGELNILLIEGHYDAALALLKRSTYEYPNDLQLQLRYHKLLAEMGVKDELAERSNSLIEKLIAANAITSAALVFLNTIKAVPEFKPASANSLLNLSEFFHERGQPRNALSMLTQLIKQHPDYPEMGKLYLKVARLYAEDLQQPDKALQVINHIQKHPNYSEAEKEEAAKLAKAL
jgi:tetratricopeptide (TPR) repeat protein